jgi:hypothetical protein
MQKEDRFLIIPVARINGISWPSAESKDSFMEISANRM